MRYASLVSVSVKVIPPDAETVICPLHGMRFDLTTGCSFDPKLTLKTYPVHVDDDGRVRVEIDP